MHDVKMGRPRVSPLAIVFALVLAACAPDAGESDDAQAMPEARTGESGEPVELPQAEVGPRQDVPSALDDMWHSSFPEPLIDPGEIMPGGPPPDGIPAIDAPKFERVADVDWLGADEAILALTIDGETRGYPFQIMTWHEIVNDTIAGVPVAVTYCPLCNSGLAFERTVGDQVLDFGTSGRLWASNLVMYDRQTESLWPQFTGEAAVGVMTGEKLDVIPVFPVGWSDFRTAHPDTWVLSRDTGHTREYGRNPYVAYDNNPDADPLFGAPVEDDRLSGLARVIALDGDDESVTVVRELVERAGVVVESVDGRPVVLFFAPGQASALDTSAVASGRDIGTVAAFSPVVDGDELTFTADNGTFVDEETGSTWTIRGQAVDGPFAGTTLDGVPFVDTFWKSWVAFRPDTRLVRSA
jgi:hypothetical protein